MATTTIGTCGRPIVALLDPNSDLLEEILQVARDHKIHSGVVHSIVGAFERATMQVFDKGGSHSHPITIEGPLEGHGGGIIGTVDAPLRGDKPFGRGVAHFRRNLQTGFCEGI
jgi:predicted DNA-binding protein with PD1-like motif